MENQQDHFIVCGLGSLGQQTIVNLKKFSQPPDEVFVTAIDLKMPSYWEVEALPDLLAQPLIIGDSRQYSLLQQAGIEHCRSILIVTSDESINVETALAARRLNPDVHIVLRSSRSNLNQLLKCKLGCFIALDAMELPANTFALSGMSHDVLSVFKIDNFPFRVIQQPVLLGEILSDGLPLQSFNSRGRRLLNLSPHHSLPSSARSATASQLFHRWQPSVRVRSGDEITVVEIDHAYQRPESSSLGRPWKNIKRHLQDFARRGWHQQFFNFWGQGEQQSLRRVTAIALSTILISWPIGTLLIKQAIPALSWGKAIALGVILLLDGYGDVFGGLEDVSLPIWLPLICLLIALASLFLVLSAFSLLADLILK